jgi:hypothetical protein
MAPWTFGKWLYLGNVFFLTFVTTAFRLDRFYVRILLWNAGLSWQVAPGIRATCCNAKRG